MKPSQSVFVQQSSSSPSLLFSEKFQFSGVEKDKSSVSTGTIKKAERSREKGLFGVSIIPPKILSDSDLFKFQRMIMNLKIHDHLLSEHVLGKETSHENDIIKILVLAEEDQEGLIAAINADKQFAGCFVSPLVSKKTHRLYSFPWKNGITLNSLTELLQKQQDLGNGICGINFRYRSLKKGDPSSLCRIMYLAFPKEIDTSLFLALDPEGGKNEVAFLRSRPIWSSEDQYQKIIMAPVAEEDIEEVIPFVKEQFTDEKTPVPVHTHEIMGKGRFKTLAVSVQKDILQEMINMRFFFFKKKRILFLKHLSFKERKEKEKQKKAAKKDLQFREAKKEVPALPIQPQSIIGATSDEGFIEVSRKKKREFRTPRAGIIPKKPKTLETNKKSSSKAIVTQPSSSALQVKTFLFGKSEKFDFDKDVNTMKPQKKNQVASSSSSPKSTDKRWYELMDLEDEKEGETKDMVTDENTPSKESSVGNEKQ